MKLEKRKVAVIGALNVDIGGRAETAFVPGDSIPGRVGLALGGVGWNIARDCALLGADTAFFSLLGLDEHAGAIRGEGQRFGVSLSGCRWVEGQNNRYLYICDERGDMVAAVNDMRLCRAMDAAFAQTVCDTVGERDAVVVDANLPEESLLWLAAHLKAPLAADCVSAVKCMRLLPILPRLHTLKANRMEAQALTGQSDPERAMKALLRAGVTRAVISLGAEGLLCGEGDRLFRRPSASAAVVDATGAGDSLTAALAVGLAKGLGPEECADLGTRAAAVALAHPGAVTEALGTLAGPDV